MPVPGISSEKVACPHFPLGRVTLTGEGTYRMAKRGYEVLRRHQANLGISCTVGKHNLATLRQSIERMVEEIQPRYVGFNFLVDWLGQRNPFDVDREEAADKVIECFEYLREQGIYEERMMRRAKAFAEELPFTRDCGAMGNQIAVFPNGDVGMCHAFIGSPHFRIGNVHQEMTAFNANAVVEKWKMLVPARRKECYRCSCFALCGGYCPYQSYATTGSIEEPDNRCCRVNQRILEWMIWDTYRQCRWKGIDEGQW